MTENKKFVRFISDGVTVALGVFGIVFGLCSSFNLTVNTGVLILVCTVLSFICGGVFGVLYRRSAAIILSALIFVACGVFITPIIRGAQLFLHTLTTIFSRFIPAIGINDIGYVTEVHRIRYSTFFFCVLGALAALGIAFLLIKYRLTSACFVLTLPPFLLCLLHLNSPPDMLPLILFASFILSSLMLDYTRKGSAKNAAVASLAVIPCVILLLVTVSAWFPEETYSRTDFADVIYLRLSQLLPIKPYSPDNSYPDESDGGSTIDIGFTDGFVDLRTSSEIQFTGETYLAVASSEKGQLLLRGNSYGTYKDSKWFSFNRDVQSALSGPDSVKMFDEQGLLYAPLTFTGILAKLYGKEPSSVYVHNDSRVGSIVYTPYYISLEATDNRFIARDSDIITTIRTQGISYTAYKIDLPVALAKRGSTDISAPLLSPNEEEYSSKASEYYSDIEKKYRALIFKYVLDDYDYTENPAVSIEQIASAVKRCGTYTLTPDEAPDDVDFLEFFLTESHEGMCMHFASVGTLAFRAAGYPARYVTGFSASVDNAYDPDTDNPLDFLNPVTDRNSHAWVEVYIDGVGWIPVDVTPGEYVLAMRGDDAETSSDESNEQESILQEQSRPEESEMRTPSDVSAPESTPFVPSDSSFPYIVLIPLALGAAYLVLVLTRRSAEASRLASFAQEDKNKAALAAWVYIQSLVPYGAKPTRRMLERAQEACFSRHTLTEADIAELVGYALSQGKAIDGNLGIFRKFMFRYIKRLY